MTRHAEHAMGTVFSFDLRDERIATNTLDEAIAWLHWVDATFSTYKDNSEISKLGRGEIRIEDCAPEVRTVLDLCAQAGAVSDGYFTAMPGGRLDPSGLVKGWAVEEVSRRLEAAGSRRHSVGGGGDVRVVGGTDPGRPWRIGGGPSATRARAGDRRVHRRRCCRDVRYGRARRARRRPADRHTRDRLGERHRRRRRPDLGRRVRDRRGRPRAKLPGVAGEHRRLQGGPSPGGGGFGGGGRPGRAAGAGAPVAPPVRCQRMGRRL